MNIQKSPSILILGRTYNQIPLAEKAKEMGFRPVVLGAGGGSPAADAVADAVYDTDTSDVDSVLDLAHDENAAGLVTCGTSTAIYTIAAVTEKLGLSDKVISAETALNAAHKDRFRELLPDLLPRGGFACSEDEAVSVAHKLQYPIVVKPSDGGGGKGITVIVSFCSDAIRSAFRYGCNFGRSQRVVVEEFLSGHVLGAESLVLDGNIHVFAIADKLVSAPPRCITLGVAFPSCLPTQTVEMIRRVNRSAIERLGIRWGATHIDMVLDAVGQPRIVDIGPRLAGGEIMARLVPKSYAYDVYGAILSLAIGQMPRAPRNADGKFYGTRFLVPETAGTLRSIVCEQSAMENSGILSIRQLVPNGTLLSEMHNDGARLLMFTASSATYESLLRQLDEFAAHVTVRID